MHTTSSVWCIFLIGMLVTVFAAPNERTQNTKKKRKLKVTLSRAQTEKHSDRSGDVRRDGRVRAVHTHHTYSRTQPQPYTAHDMRLSHSINTWPTEMENRFLCSPRYFIWMSKFQWKNICTEDKTRTQNENEKNKAHTHTLFTLKFILVFSLRFFFFFHFCFFFSFFHFFEIEIRRDELLHFNCIMPVNMARTDRHRINIFAR